MELTTRKMRVVFRGKLARCESGCFGDLCSGLYKWLIIRAITDFRFSGMPLA